MFFFLTCFSFLLRFALLIYMCTLPILHILAYLAIMEGENSCALPSVGLKGVCLSLRKP